MFILCEQDGFNNVYDLKNKIRLEEKDGKLQCFQIKDNFTFGEDISKDKNKIIFIPHIPINIQYIGTFLISGCSITVISKCIARGINRRAKALEGNAKS